MKSTTAEIRKSSAGKNESEASQKTDGLIYNYKLRNDSLSIDEYFTIPSGRKWAADNIEVTLKVPEGTIIKFDKASKLKIHSMRVASDGSDEIWYSRWESGVGYWIMTDDGLRVFEKKSPVKKIISLIFSFLKTGAFSAAPVFLSSALCASFGLRPSLSIVKPLQIRIFSPSERCR